MPNKTLIGFHWLSLIWLIIILVLSGISLYVTNKAKKNEDPTADLNSLKGLTISLIVLVSILVLPILLWVYKQSKIGFSEEMVDIVF